ncbi:MAG: prepilin-type N-terminal cleavage/methylation domain-containing protein [Myxococcota bacterium]
MLRASRPRGFTLIEMMIVVAIIGIAAALAVDSLSRNTRREQWRGAVRQVVGLVNEARSTAILLGNAPGPAGLSRVTDADGDCAAALLGGLPDMTATPGLAINAATHNAVLISRVTPTFPAGGVGLSRAPVYDIDCRTVNLDRDFGRSFQVGVVGWQNDGTNYFVTFDGRGMMTGGGAPVRGLEIYETAPAAGNPRVNGATQTVLVLGSGQPCLEGTTPLACARTN